MNSEKVDIAHFKRIELRDSQLWWLAVFIMTLLALAVFALDYINSRSVLWTSPTWRIAINTVWLRSGLVISTLVICAYFRETARKLRCMNSELVKTLTGRSKLLEKKNHELLQLKTVSEELIGVADLQKALNMVLDTAVEITSADTASIMLREKDEDTLKIVAAHGLPQEIVESTCIRMGDAIAGLVAEDQKAIILNSDDLPPALADRAHRKTSIVSSVLAPIQIDGETRGMVNIAKRRPGDCFSEEDLSVISTLANQISLAVQKVELDASLRHQIDLLASALEDLRKKQAELIEADKLASIGQLAGGVAHELNNPLQIILGRAELLLAAEKREPNMGSMKAIIENTLRMADIVGNLLSFSRRSSDSNTHEMHINAVVNKTLDLLEPEMTQHNIVIVRNLQENLRPINGNSGQLQQVFTNIVLNAYQAMRGEGGGTLRVLTASDSDGIRIDLENTGPSISMEDFDRIFEPFFTTKAEGEGTGLGLSIVHGIVQAHGGRIEASNKPDGGVCFSITLPALEDSNQRKAA